MATLHFCYTCGNTLYPKEEKDRRKLVYACMRCDYKEDADDSLVYRHELVRTLTTALDKINPDLIFDPTLQTQADAICAKCEERDPGGPRHGAVFFQPSAAMSSEDRMSLIFICRNPSCGHRWQG